MDPRRPHNRPEQRTWVIDDDELQDLEHPRAKAELPQQVTLRRMISQRLEKDRFPIPPLPTVLVELQQITNSREPDLRAACSVIERDPTLSGRVLAVASSAAYGLAVPDLGRAVLRLGINGLRDITYALLLGQVFRGHGGLDGLMEREHHRAFPRARACQAIFHLQGVDHTQGFLTGLLIDVGRMALIAMLASEKEAKDVGEEAIRPLIDELHAEVSALVMSRWELPRELVDLARNHHHREPETLGPMGKKIRALAGAERLCRQVELIKAGLDPQDALEALFKAREMRDSGVNPEWLPDLLEIVDQAYSDNTLVG